MFQRAALSRCQDCVQGPLQEMPTSQLNNPFFTYIPPNIGKHAEANPDPQT